MKGVLIPCDSELPMQVVEFDRDYRNIQKHVGGLFEVIDIPRTDACLFCNEEGKIIGLPLNVRATEFLYAHRSEYIGYDAIMGDVLVLGDADENGDTMSCPDWLIEHLLRAN